ncbi:C39 family peptidase [bacterium]|nr:C39 family peptidase [bacterium]
MKINLKPYQQEKPYTCLPACCRTVLAFLGQCLTEDEIVSLCGTRKSGTLLIDALHGIQQLGFNVTLIKDGTLDLLLDYLYKHEPVIVGIATDKLPYGTTGGHAIVVCGVEEEKIVYIDPVTGSEERLDLFAFMRAWRRQNSRALIISRR